MKIIFEIKINYKGNLKVVFFFPQMLKQMYTTKTKVCFLD